jgi:hypothetical protein
MEHQDLKGPGGELHATVQIKRKTTGKVETYELVARTTPEQHARIMHGASGAMVGQGAAVSNQPKED